MPTDSPSEGSAHQLGEIEITEAMIEAGRAAFRRWVSSGKDEEAVQEMPSDESLACLVVEILHSRAC